MYILNPCRKCLVKPACRQRSTCEQFNNYRAHLNILFPLLSVVFFILSLGIVGLIWLFLVSVLKIKFVPGVIIIFVLVVSSIIYFIFSKIVDVLFNIILDTKEL